VGEEKAIVPAPVLPLVTPEQAAEQWRRFEALKEKLLVEDDYQMIAGKRFIKRSGFRKIGVFFGLSDRILKEERVERPDGSFVWRLVVEVSAPNGRMSIGVGACDSKERKFAHPEHDVYATAHTRAKSRAISDMVAGGIVSAEEVEPPMPSPAPAPPATRPPGWEPKVPVTKEPATMEGLRQFPLLQGQQAVGMLNVLGDEASVVPEGPVPVEDGAIQGFLVKRVLEGFREKGFEYVVWASEVGLLEAVLIRGRLADDQIKDLGNGARWAFLKAMERVG